jgi:hypothetical protein
MDEDADSNNRRTSARLKGRSHPKVYLSDKEEEVDGWFLVVLI